MSWNSLSNFKYIMLPLFHSFTRILLHYRILLNSQSFTILPEFCYFTRLILHYWNSITLQKFGCVTGLPLHCNIPLYYNTRISISLPEFCFDTVPEFCNIMEFHYITGNPIYKITGILSHYQNDLSLLTKSLFMLPEFKYWYYVCLTRNR